MPDGAELARAPVPESVHRAADPNPRGGLRGARGISAFGDRLVIGNAERLFVIRPDWRIISEITNPLMGGIHGVLAVEDGIWVTCTMADLLLKVDWEGNLIDDWEWRRDAALVQALELHGLPRVDRTVDYREPDSSRTHVRNTIHLNAVNRSHDGLVLSFGRIISPAVYRKRTLSRMAVRVVKAVGVMWSPTKARRKSLSSVPSGIIEGSSHAIVRLSENGESEILFQQKGTAVPNHDVYRDDDLIVYNDTNRSRLLAVSLETGAEVYEVPIPGEPSFARGLAHLGDLRFLVGSQRPAAVYEVDLESRSIVNTYVLSSEAGESVTSIAVVPNSFDKVGRDWRFA